MFDKMMNSRWISGVTIDGFLDFMKDIDMFSTSGYMGANYVQEFGPGYFDMSSASGYMGAKYFQEFDPSFLTCLPAKK